MGKKDELYQKQLEERRRQRAEAEAAKKAAKRKQMLTTALIAAGVVLVIVLICVVALGSVGGDKEETESESRLSLSESVAQVQENYDYSIDVDKKNHVEIVVEDYGTIKVELDPSYAPITVDNFITLAEEGFYDGLTFHRIIDGFMIQGGDPKHNGQGGSDTPILGEFSENGATNTLAHKRGVISMARRGDDMNSASSQFFICHEDTANVFALDGKYAAFGWVTEGMEIVDAIVEAANPTDNNGTIPYEEQPVIKTIIVID